MRRLYPLVVLAAALAGCEPGGVSGIDLPEAEGTVRGIVYLDRNGNGRLDANTDAALPAIRIRLAAGATATSSVSDADGRFPNLDLRIGTYDVSVETIPDSIEVVRIDGAPLTIASGDTSTVIVHMGYPRRTVAAARSTPQGRRISVDGVLLNNWNTFGDSTLHVWDGTSAIRLTGAPATNLSMGDSVRVVGRVASRAGAPVLSDPTLYLLGTAAATPTLLTIADAQKANAGKLDAALVRVRGTISRDPVQTTGGDALLTLVDGSSSLGVLLDRDAQITTSIPLRIGAELEVTGLLVQSGAGGGDWQLKPRMGRDLSPSYPLSSVRSARGRSDTYVRVRGVALNSGGALADRSIHIAGDGAAIRVFPGTRSSILEGDTVEVLGDVMTLGDGQPAITSAMVAFVASGPRSDGVAVSTNEAAGAKGGTLDAALVRLSNVPITALIQVPGQARVTLDDGSGPMVVLVLSTNGVTTSGLAVGQTISVRGLLVPGEVGKWMLLLRSAQDLTVH